MAVTSQTGIKIVLSFSILVYLNLDIVVTLKVLVVFSYAKTNEKTNPDWLDYIVHCALWDESFIRDLQC